MKRYSIFTARAPGTRRCSFSWRRGWLMLRSHRDQGVPSLGNHPDKTIILSGSQFRDKAVPLHIHPVSGSQPDSRIITGTDPVKDKLNRANREAADIDRDGRISPEEASRVPPALP